MPQIAGFRGAVVDSPTKKPSDLARDDARALYRYHQMFKHPVDGRSVTRKSFFVAVRLAPWAQTIRATEAIDAAERDAALQQLTATATETQAILAGYRDAAGEIERLLRRIDTERPIVDITVDDVGHRLWRSRDAELLGKVQSTIAPKKLQVLDGHARYDAMLAYQAKLDAQSSLAVHSSGNYGLMCLTALEDTALVPAPRHRILRGAKPKDELLAAVQPQFIVEKLAGAAGNATQLRTALADSVAHQPAFVLAFKDDPDAWKLTLSPDVTVSNQGIAVHRGMQHLDPIVVDALFLGRHGTGATVTTETSTVAALAQLKAGADAIVIMRPVTVEQMIHVGDLGQALPPGSTAFYPPVLPLVSYVVEPDIDLV